MVSPEPVGDPRLDRRQSGKTLNQPIATGRMRWTTPTSPHSEAFTDLLSHYRTEESGIAFGQDDACVTGEMRDGTPIEGCDSIVMVGSCGIGFELVLVVPALMWVYRRRGRRADLLHPR